jgi:hypothetical protein
MEDGEMWGRCGITEGVVRAVEWFGWFWTVIKVDLDPWNH